MAAAYLGPNSSSFICLFGDPRAYVSPSRYLSIANNTPEETRAVLVDLVSGTEKNLSSQTEFADCLFAASGNQLAVLDFDGKVKLYDLADAKEQDPKTISSTIIRRLLAIDAKSQTVFGLSGSSIIGINTQDGNSEFELSGVVPPLKINTEYDRWQLNLPNDSPLILVRDLRATSYPRSPLNHAEQMAPRGLTEQERNEFFLSQ